MKGTSEMSDTSRTWPSWAPRPPLFRHKCPCCNSVKFRQAELRTWDGLLAMFALRPVRCMFCWRRYYWVSLVDAPAAGS
jgi:hypothetical protein